MEMGGDALERLERWHLGDVGPLLIAGDLMESGATRAIPVGKAASNAAVNASGCGFGFNRNPQPVRAVIASKRAWCCAASICGKANCTIRWPVATCDPTCSAMPSSTSRA